MSDEDDLVMMFSEYVVRQDGGNLVLTHICDEEWGFPVYPVEATAILRCIVTHDEVCPK